MAFLNRFVKKDDELDIEEFLNTLDVQGEDVYEDADALVKPVTLTDDSDCQNVLKEAKEGNIVLVNIGGISKRNSLKLKEYVDLIKNGVGGIDGDIARISNEKILITPSKVKIVKKRPDAE